MTRQDSLAWVVITASVVSCLQTGALAQTTSDRRNESKLATISASESGVKWSLDAPDSAVTLVVAAPDGRIFRREFKAGASPEFTITDNEKKPLPDGQYTYELRLSPVVSRDARRALAAQRGRDTDSEAVRTARKAAVPAQPHVESGSFSIVQGAVIVAGEVERESKRQGDRALQQLERSGGTIAATRTRSEPYFSPIALRAATEVRDQVIPDDLIVQGSTCVGFDCVNNENFGFDTIRLKENNLRLHFDDTSVSAGFPTTNWQIRANDSASGGAGFLGIVDMGASGASDGGSVVLAVDAGAPANALRVSNTGRIGVRTATPVLDLHIVKTDTPAHRLEQTSAGGFGAQTWDIAGNEANFFVRDVTGGSRLPLRIRPGAPTSSLDISAAGNVGIGTSAPRQPLHVASSATPPQMKSTNDTSGHSIVDGLSIGLSAADSINAEIWNYENGFLRLGANNAEVLRITGGNVGIGTTAPTEMLSVNGNASKPGGGSWAVFSDRRLKTVKGNFTQGLSAVMQLQPIRYEYRRDNALQLPSNAEHVGFEAQAVVKVIPEAVSRNGNGYLQIDNDPILWAMLNAIREQQAQIEQLREEVRQLRAVSRREHK